MSNASVSEVAANTTSVPDAEEPVGGELVDDELHPASARAPTATHTPAKVLLRCLGPRRLGLKLTRLLQPFPVAALPFIASPAWVVPPCLLTLPATRRIRTTPQE